MKYIESDFVKESRQEMQRSEKKSILFVKGVLIGKSIFQIQRIDPVLDRCSISDVLRDIPSNFIHLALGDELYYSFDHGAVE